MRVTGAHAVIDLHTIATGQARRLRQLNMGHSAYGQQQQLHLARSSGRAQTKQPALMQDRLTQFSFQFNGDASGAVLLQHVGR